MNTNDYWLNRIQRALAFVVLSLFFYAFAAGTVFFCGCTTGNDGIYIDKTVWVYVTNKVDRAVEKHESQGSATGGTAVDVGSSSGAVAEPSSSFSADWRYGGFNGGKAVEDKACQISAISVSSKGVTFKFSGGGSWWGATHDNPTMRCCAFYKDGSGKWVGGFWEWGSPDRTYRAFTNINDGYKGWDAKAFHASKKHAFVICSKDGKRRSNFIEQ